MSETITVNKLKTQLDVNAITTVYNIKKELLITLKDSQNNPLRDVKVSVSLNGDKTFTTDKNGQIKVSTNALAPKSYVATITFEGNINYAKHLNQLKSQLKRQILK